MDIFEHIMKEHREVEGMMRTLSNGFDQRTVDDLKLVLAAHMGAEEGSLFPAIGDIAADLVEHAREEHDEIRERLGTLSEGGGFASKVSILTEVIDDHFKDEEDDIFPKAKTVLDRGEIGRLSSKFDELDDRIAQRAK